MGMKCPACGGELVFDVDKHKLICYYCDSEFDPDEYNVNNNADKVQGFSEAEETDNSNSFIMDTYICRNCGAELSAPEEQTVAYCAYCGGEAILNGKTKPEEAPVDMIPFKKSKKQAENAYKKALEKKFFVPKEFKSPEFINGFRGIYIPYWRFKLGVAERELHIKGSKSYSSGSYDYYETYDVEARLGGDIYGYSYDASAAFDDTVANEIAPFKVEDAERFNQSYLAGFYVDRATTPSETYEPLIGQQVVDGIGKGLEKKTGVSLNNNDWKKNVSITNNGKWVSLFPVWFLTWKKGDRVAYSVMNGQTGKVTMDIPVDKSRFFMYTGIYTLILWAILSILPMFMLPLNLAGISSCLLLISSLVLNGLLKSIFYKEQHVFDYGYKDEKGKTRKRYGLKSGVGSGCLKIFLWIAIIFWMWITGFVTTTPSGLQVAFILMLPLCVVVHMSTIFRIASLEHKVAFINPIFCLAVNVLSIIFSGKAFPHDFWYYGISVGCLVGMIYNCTTAIFYLNYLTTRPVPNFFTREGADNGKQK